MIGRTRILARWSKTHLSVDLPQISTNSSCSAREKSSCGRGTGRKGGDHRIYEEFVHPAVRGQFGVEGSGEQVSLANQDGRAIAASQNLDLAADLGDARSADEDHLQWTAGKRGGLGQDSGVDLASVGIALHNGIQDAEAALRGVPDLAGQQNGSRTGPEYGLLPAKLKKGFKEPAALEELEHGGRFAARKNEAIKPGKLFGVADLDGLGAGICERPGVGGVIPLKGEYADARAESLCRKGTAAVNLAF